MKSTKWLDRILMVGPHLTLCTSKAEFNAALDHLRIPKDNRGNWLGAGGKVHTYERGSSITCIVCVKLKDIKKRPICEVANILVHEAVHVWQQHHSNIGESNPSPEFEAYSIQSIFTTLFTEALERRNK
jgi:hypothetical protein